MRRRRPRVEERISILVPFQTKDFFRIIDWAWILLYLRCHIRDVQIVIGVDRSSKRPWWDLRDPRVFSKTHAINDAFRRSNGDIIVILDADVYLKAKVIKHCAHRLRVYRKQGLRYWFMPYDMIYRLTREATAELLESDPCWPLEIPDPPPPCDVEGYDGSGPGYGALVQIMPREAFEAVGGHDERFRGWGGEDVSFLYALCTLWGPFKQTHNDVLHLWHPRLVIGQGRNYQTRVWEGQDSPQPNNRLAAAYKHANGDRDLMLSVIHSGKKSVLTFD